MIDKKVEMENLIRNIKTRNLQSDNGYLEIAIIDDDPEMIHILKKFLHSNLNCNIFSANEPHHFFSILQEENIDLCIMDIHIGNINAFDFHAFMNKFMILEIPTLFISAAALQDVSKIKRVHFLKKPFSPTKLIASIIKTLS